MFAIMKSKTPDIRIVDPNPALYKWITSLAKRGDRSIPSQAERLLNAIKDKNELIIMEAQGDLTITKPFK